MRVKGVHSIAAWVAVLSTASGLAQSASMRLDTAEIPLGGQTRLHIALELPPAGEDNLPWHAFADTITRQIEIVQAFAIDTVRTESRYELSQTLVITSFDTGYVVLPPIAFGTGENRIETNPLLLHVVAPQVEPMMRDIKGIIEVEYTLLDWLIDHLWWLVGGAAVVLLIFFILRRWRMRPRTAPIEPVAVEERLPAPEEALQALAVLAEKRLWEKGEVKAYHSELTDILRVYIERRYHVRTMERTTRQILTDLRMAGVPGDAYDRLKATLQLADVVKFAKFIPEAEEHTAAHDNALFFVQATRQTAEQHG